MEQNEIFAGDDPFEITRRWLDEATKTEVNDPNAIALATVDAEGLPNVRTVLLKQIEQDGFVFFTNYESAKGQEIAANGKAAFVMHWKTLGRQVRVRGAVSKLEAAKSDAYFHSRALVSRIGAWASAQSRRLESRATLEAKVNELTTTLGESPDRPPHWGGYKIVPQVVEFWADGAHRLHDRFLWERTEKQQDWHVTRLWP